MDARNRRLKLRVTAAAERALRSGHPWVYADSVQEVPQPGQAADLAVVYDRKNRFLAVGFYDPHSPIRVRVLAAGKPQAIDLDFWKRRLAAAVEKRAGLFDAHTNGYRWINGESDGWPGLVLDRYADSLVMKVYTAAWCSILPEIAALVADHLKPARLVLRLSRNLQALLKKPGRLSDGETLVGAPNATTTTFLETGLRFEAAIYRGQKTGFFLDQRENRRLVEKLAAGRAVLNTFSFTGGFSLYAARGGAASVTDVDISPLALEGARRNFDLNRSAAAIRSCRHEMVQADVFDWLLRKDPRKYDLVIVDPPSLAKREADRSVALQAYRKLAGAGIDKLRRGGILVAASCSAHVTAQEFCELVREAARFSRRPFSESQVTGHPPDHPAAFPEAAYLKCIYLEFR